MTERELWENDGRDYGWQMPSAPLWKRLPVIRHVRAIYNVIMIDRHERLWRSLGAIPSGYDRWVVWGIWHGQERANG